MRKIMTLTAVLLALTVPAGYGQSSSAPRVKVEMYKTPTCGCCAKWAQHLEKAGFDVAITDMPQAELQTFKTSKGIPEGVRSCHTALVGGYVIEGHVPSDVVAKLLAERPAGVLGIAVPGMPAGSPGMESADGFKTPYQVMAFTKDGQSRVYASK